MQGTQIKKRKKTIDGVWENINKGKYLDAKKDYFQLSEKEKQEYDAKLAKIRIHQGLKEFSDALDLVKKLPPKASTSKAHARILVDIERYQEALKYFEEIYIDENNIEKKDFEVLFGKLKCYHKLGQRVEAGNIVQILSPYETQPNVAIALSYMYYDYKEPNNAENAITIVPHYQRNVLLVRHLIQLYGKTKQFDKIKFLVKNLPPYVSADLKFKIDYSDALLKVRNKEYFNQAKKILDELLAQNLPYEEQRRIIVTILNNKVHQSFQENIENYLKKNPTDKQLILQAENTQNQPLLKELLKNPEQNTLALKNYLRNSSTVDNKTALSIYKVLVRQDPEQTDPKLWREYATSLIQNQEGKEAFLVLQPLINKYPTLSILYTTIAKCNLNTPEKEALLRQGMTDCPDSTSILHLLVATLYEQEKYHTAIEQFRQFTKTYPDKIEVKVELCYAYIKGGFVKKAQHLLKKLIDNHPDAPTVIATYGQCLMQANLFFEAKLHYQTYQDHPLYWNTFSQGHAICLERAGDHTAAFAILEKLCQQIETPEGYITLIKCIQDAAKLNKEIKNAQFYIEKALKLYPENITLLISISYYYHYKKQNDLATRFINMALKKDPNHPHTQKCAYNITQHRNATSSSQNTSAQDLFQVAADCIKKDELFDAKQILEVLHKKTPNARNTFLLQAQYFEALGYYDSAQKQIESIKKRFGGLVLLEALQEANILRSQRKYHDAIKLLLEILRKSPNDIPTLLRLSDCYLQTMDYDSAKKYCFDVLKLNQNDLKSLLMLARINNALDKVNEVSKYLEEATKINPYEKNVILLKANLFKKLGDYEKGILILLEGYDRHPKNMRILLQLFYFLHFIDDLDRASKYIDKLNQLYPKHYEVILANIRFKLTKFKQASYPEIEELFKDLMHNFPSVPKIFAKYAFFVKRRSGVLHAIQTFERYLPDKLKHYFKAYNELASLYISIKNLNQAEKTYLKGIENNPNARLLQTSYFYFLLFIKNPREHKTILSFYQQFIKNFKSDETRSRIEKYLFRANLQEYIERKESHEELTQKMNELTITNSLQASFKNVQLVLEKFQEFNNISYCIGGAARFKFLLEKGKLAGKLNDFDIYTNCTTNNVNIIFPQVTQSVYVNNKLNLFIQKDKFDINYIGAQILDIAHFLHSQYPLNFDCLALKSNGNYFDPTNKAIVGLLSGTLDFIADINETCEKNAILFFRIIRYLAIYNCQLAQGLQDADVLKKMVHLLRKNYTEGKIITQITKMLLCGRSYECFALMHQEKLLAILNPDLDNYLNFDPLFKTWFFHQLWITDQMIESQITPCKPYTLAIYLLASIFKFQQMDEFQGACIDEMLLEDFIYKTFGDRKDRPCIRQYLQQFYTSFLYDYQMNLCWYNTPTQIASWPEEVKEAPLDLNVTHSANTYLPGWHASLKTSNLTTPLRTVEAPKKRKLIYN